MKKFVLALHWGNDSLLINLNQKVGDSLKPTTVSFLWPQTDAWEDIRKYLNKQNWISKSDSILILNHITEVIECWELEKSSNKKDVTKLKERFFNSRFTGRSQLAQLTSFN